MSFYSVQEGFGCRSPLPGTFCLQFLFPSLRFSILRRSYFSLLFLVRRLAAELKGEQIMSKINRLKTGWILVMLVLASSLGRAQTPPHIYSQSGQESQGSKSIEPANPEFPSQQWISMFLSKEGGYVARKQIKLEDLPMDLNTRNFSPRLMVLKQFGTLSDGKPLFVEINLPIVPKALSADANEMFYKSEFVKDLLKDTGRLLMSGSAQACLRVCGCRKQCEDYPSICCVELCCGDVPKP
jgi:hypothetical protein